MHLNAIVDEDFSNYKLPCMFLGTTKCTFKCCTEQNLPITNCQNSENIFHKSIDISNENLYERYAQNPISSAIVLGGLEPMDTFEELISFVVYMRITKQDLSDIVIYTGYNEDEVKKQIDRLKDFPNIIVKFGRYIPYQKKHYDEILGVYLISNNQYAKRISI